MPKLVRKSQTSLRSLLLDWALEVSENLRLLDWESLSSRWIIPLGVCLNLFDWLVCLQSSYLRKTVPEDVFERSGASTSFRYSTASWWSRTLSMTTIVLCLISVCNAWYCFSRKREYQIRTKPDPWSIQDTDRPLSASDTPKSLLGRLAPQRPPSRDRLKQADQQTVLAWDPSIVSLRVLAVFSPVHTLLIWTASHSAMVLVLIGLLSLQMLYLVQIYDRHVRDKQLIYGQVFSEYESQFVQPRTNIMKRDVGVGTRPDDNGVYVEVHTPKFGIVDAARTAGMPRSASQIRMHEWEKPLSLAGGGPHNYPASPNVWAQSPSKQVQAQAAQSTRHSIASPRKVNGSPVKMFKPAGWGSGSLNPFEQQQQQQEETSNGRQNQVTSRFMRKLQ